MLTVSCVGRDVVQRGFMLGFATRSLIYYNLLFFNYLTDIIFIMPGVEF